MCVNSNGTNVSDDYGDVKVILRNVHIVRMTRPTFAYFRSGKRVSQSVSQ